MSRLRLVNQATAPDTPGANEGVLYLDGSGNICVKRADGSVQSLAGAGVLTIPGTGTAALRNLANTFSLAQQFDAGINLAGGAQARAAASPVSVGTSPTTIAAFASGHIGMLVLVFGTDGVASFLDLVLALEGGGTVTIASRTVSYTVTRTYTAPGGGVLQLAVSAGTWGTRTHVISNIKT
jgi:hypothetical protein